MANTELEKDLMKLLDKIIQERTDVIVIKRHSIPRSAFNRMVLEYYNSRVAEIPASEVQTEVEDDVEVYMVNLTDNNRYREYSNTKHNHMNNYMEFIEDYVFLHCSSCNVDEQYLTTVIKSDMLSVYKDSFDTIVTSTRDKNLLLYIQRTEDMLGVDRDRKIDSILSKTQTETDAWN
jgi:hypothetical protein